VLKQAGVVYTILRHFKLFYPNCAKVPYHKVHKVMHSRAVNLCYNNDWLSDTSEQQN